MKRGVSGTMKRALLLPLLLALLFCAASLSAQTPDEKNALKMSFSPVASYSIPLQTTQNGKFIALATRGGCTITDTQGNTWLSAASGLWYVGNSAGGAETITVTCPATFYFEAAWAVYPGARVLDVASATNSGTSAVAVSRPLNATAGDLLIGFGQNTTTYSPGFTPPANFTVEATGYITFLEDAVQAATGPVYSSMSYAAPVSWTQGIAAFRPAVLPPPLPTVTLAVAGRALFDDGTPILPSSSANVTQLENGTWTPIGTAASDSTGALSGSIVVDPNFVSNGTIWLSLSLVGIPAPGSEGIDPRMVQQGSTGVLLNIVVFKSIGLPKSVTLALTP